MSEFLTLTITAMVPFLFVAQGTMLSGRAGIFNVAQEGLMLLGAAVGYIISLKAGGNVVGLIAAALAGALVGFVLSWATTSLRLDQFVVGLALFFLAGGAASLLYRVVIGNDEPPRIAPLPEPDPRPGRHGVRRARAVGLPVVVALPHRRRYAAALRR